MDKSILALIDEARELLLPDKTDYQQPDRKFLYVSFLAPEGNYRIGNLCHSYNPSIDVINYHKIHHEHLNMIFHGHTENELCAAPHFCHLLGYRPSETNSPAFRKAFQQKWNY